MVEIIDNYFDLMTEDGFSIEAAKDNLIDMIEEIANTYKEVE